MDFGEMKDRIAHIIRAKNLTAAEFATQLGIQPSNISHLLSGRNNPSLDFVKKLKETYPEYNLDWIIMGRGPMTVSEPFVEPKSQQNPVAIESGVMENERVTPQPTLFSELRVMAESDEPLRARREDARLKQMIFVYDDRSFEILLPRWRFPILI